MATQNNNGSELGPNPVVAETPEPKPEKIDTLDDEIPIEKIVGKITLACDPPSVEVNENEDKDNTDDEDDSSSESESESESQTGSESESSSSSASSSSSSGSDEDGEIRDSDEEKMVSWSADGGDFDDDDDDEVVVGPIRSKNEIPNLPPIPSVDVTLEPHHKMQPVEVVMSTLGAQVIVEGVEKHKPLNAGSILWLIESRKPLGLVDEIFGPVKNPYYVVRYNSENDIPGGIQGGITLVSCVPEYADRVLNNKDLYRKGYDASGPNDEELSDEVEFSDDEKEAEYRKMQRMTKRGNSDQNPGKRRNNKNKFSLKEQGPPTLPNASAAAQHVLHTAPNAPAVAPLVNHGNRSFLGTGQGGSAAVSPFQLLNAGSNFAANAMWGNQATFPQQSQLSLLPNAFPTNAMSYYPQSTQVSHQFLVPGGPFQQQLNPSHRAPFPNMMSGLQPNIYPQQPMYAPGFVGQNQMPFDVSSSFQQNQPPHIFQAQRGSFQQNQPPPIFQAQLGSFQQNQPPPIQAQQGFSPTELQQPSPSSASGNPSQFHPGSSASRGRQTFHAAGRKGWRPAR